MSERKQGQLTLQNVSLVTIQSQLRIVAVSLGLVRPELCTQDSAGHPFAEIYIYQRQRGLELHHRCAISGDNPRRAVATPFNASRMLPYIQIQQQDAPEPDPSYRA